MTQFKLGPSGPGSRSSVPVDSDTFKAALGHYASGITIVTACDDEGPVGFTCQSFYSLSIDPPLISFSVMKSSSSYPRIRKGGRFAVNVLATSQEAISNQFAKKGSEKWKGIDWHRTDTGNPVIPGCLTWLDCEIYEEFEVGDHYLVIGQVLATEINPNPPQEPLLYFKGAYRHLGLSDPITCDQR